MASSFSNITSSIFHKIVSITRYEGISMEDYAIRRREYVKQIRASFDQPSEEGYIFQESDTEDEPIHIPFLGFKIRLFIATILFCSFLFCKYTSYPLFGMEVSKIIDMIRDNQYYTFLENCDILKDIELFYKNLQNSIRQITEVRGSIAKENCFFSKITEIIQKGIYPNDKISIIR